MAVITFDEEKRREYKEPQTTKTELLRPPHNTVDQTYGTDWKTPRGAPGLGDLYTSNSTWSFSNIGNVATPAVPSVGPMKVEAASPVPETVGQERYHEHDEELDLMSKKARDENTRAVRAVSGTSSDDRFGRKTGVIDLTLDDDTSDEEDQPQPLPERQYVPRAEDDDDDLASFLRRKSPSPPRTFTRGLSPIAAHPRKAPIVYRSKPPIKPENRRQSTFSPSPARTAHQIFNRNTRSPSHALNAPRTSTPSARSPLAFSLEGFPLGSTTATSSATFGNRNQSADEKPTGPFVQDDDSDGDEEMARALDAPRDSSLASVINRPRQDTPARNDLASIQEESRRMREQALERTQSRFATTTNVVASASNANTLDDSTPTLSDALWDVPIPSIEFPSQQAANEARQPPVRPPQTEITYQARKRSVCLLDSRTELEEPRKRQKTLPAYHEATKSNHAHHASPRDHFQGLIQRAQTQARNTVQPFIQPTNHNHHQSTPSAQDEARRKAAVAAQQRQTESQNIATLKAHIRQQNEKKAEEERALLQGAWHKREMAKPKTHSPPPEKRATLPGPEPVVPRAAAPPKPRAHPKKQQMSILDQISAKSKQAKQRQARQLKSIHDRGRTSEDEEPDAEAQRQAEENHALAKPPPYQPLLSHKADGAPHQSAVLRVPPPQPSNLHHQPLPDDDDGEEEDSTHAEKLKGPFAANSVAGVQAIKKSLPPRMNLPFDDDEMPSTTAAQRFMGTASKKISFKKMLKKPEALYITANELKLYKWRQEKVRWAEVRERWDALNTAFQYKGEERLRDYFRAIEAAIEIEEISTNLCEQVIAGDKEAEVELNRLVNLRKPVSKSDGDGSTTPFKKIVKPDRARTVAPNVVAAPTPRPTQGGKNLDDAAYLHLLENARGAWVSDTDSEESESRQCSPMREEDRVHWRYFMERRDFVADVLAGQEFEDLEEEIQWMEYGRLYDQLQDANVEACRFIYTSVAGGPKICTTGKSWDLSYDELENDMIMLTLRAKEPDLGIVQVRVNRRLVTFHDYIEPTTKEGWMPRTLYRVSVKCRKLDELFGEDDDNEQTPFESEVDGNSFGTLEQANNLAIREWVSLTRKPCSANLDQIEVDRAEARKELQRELEEAGGGTLFKAKAEFDGKMVKVAVKISPYQGPRN